MLGTIRFIGELFILGMLNAKTMSTCIQMLLENPVEENIEVCNVFIAPPAGKQPQ